MHMRELLEGQHLEASFMSARSPVIQHAQQLATFHVSVMPRRARLASDEKRCQPLAVLQAASRADVFNSATDSSSEVPDCRVLGNSAVMGHLPEVLPASLMHHPAFQQLHLQLLPFQVTVISPSSQCLALPLPLDFDCDQDRDCYGDLRCDHEQELEGLQQGIALMVHLTGWAVHLPTPDIRGPTPAAPQLLLGQLRESLQAGLQGGAMGVLQTRPKQLLLWLLETEHKVRQLASTLGVAHWGGGGNAHQLWWGCTKNHVRHSVN